MSSIQPKSLYHDIDTRKNMYELDNLPYDEKNALYPDLDKINENALAVACLMTNQELIETPQGYRLSTQVNNLYKVIFNTFGVPLADHEKFPKELAPGFGSAFFIKHKLKKNILLSAGHCFCERGTSNLMSKEKIKNIRVVFRYHKTNANIDKMEFEKDDVYRVKKVILFGYNHKNYNPHNVRPFNPDFVLLKLDRPVCVVGINPISINFSIEKGRSIYVLGHPTGMALKFADQATIKEIHSDRVYGDVDILGGNSGGPVFDRKTHEAIAIVVSGHANYVLDNVHKEKTGENRVITFRITQEMINSGAYSYSGLQAIKPEMLDLCQFVAKKERKKRKELSEERSSSIYSDDYIKILDDPFEKIECTHYPPTVVPSFTDVVRGIFGKSIEIKPIIYYKEVSKLEKLDEKFNKVKNVFKSNKINYYESKILGDLDLNKKYSDYEAKKMRMTAKNKSAYNLEWKTAMKLREIEEVFDKKFSPAMILDLLNYFAEKKIRFSNDTMERMLICMHKKDSEGRFISIHEARTRAYAKFIMETWIKQIGIEQVEVDPKYYKNEAMKHARSYMDSNNRIEEQKY